jgi:hypothetical protein
MPHRGPEAKEVPESNICVAIEAQMAWAEMTATDARKTINICFPPDPTDE